VLIVEYGNRVGRKERGEKETMSQTKVDCNAQLEGLGDRICTSVRAALLRRLWRSIFSREDWNEDEQRALVVGGVRLGIGWSWREVSVVCDFC
jgi:hypothetical protein